MAENNKDTAVTFLNMIMDGRIREAFSKFVSERFEHHNPYFDGSARALMVGMEENTRQSPEKILKIKHVITEDEFVVVHSHLHRNPNDELGVAIVYIFRFEDGQIAELWDIGQPVPENLVNENGMF
jgi:predicted SnoaL-like aldol condensation-catalyzing enzyme